MIRVIECEKICLKAETGKMLFNNSHNIYTPKAYLHSESEVEEWTEVSLSDVPTNEPTDEEYSEVGKILMGVIE